MIRRKFLIGSSFSLISANGLLSASIRSGRPISQAASAILGASRCPGSRAHAQPPKLDLVASLHTQTSTRTRVCMQHQNLDRQLGALVAEGCAEIFQEKASGGSTMRRPQLGTGDVLVLAEWDRATRSMLVGIQIIQRVAGRGAW